MYPKILKPATVLSLIQGTLSTKLASKSRKNELRPTTLIKHISIHQDSLHTTHCFQMLACCRGPARCWGSVRVRWANLKPKKFLSFRLGAKSLHGKSDCEITGWLFNLGYFHFKCFSYLTTMTLFRRFMTFIVLDPHELFYLCIFNSSSGELYCIWHERAAYWFKRTSSNWMGGFRVCFRRETSTTDMHPHEIPERDVNRSVRILPQCSM